MMDSRPRLSFMRPQTVKVDRLPAEGIPGFPNDRFRARLETSDSVLDLVLDRRGLIDLIDGLAAHLDDFGLAEVNRRAVTRYTRPVRDAQCPIPSTDLRFVSKICA